MPIPVVIGSGLTGLSISHSLSRAAIEHVLIGRRPDMSPRLGESLNLEGTLLLREMFPQLERFFFPKRQVLGYLGAHEVVCDFDVGVRFVSRPVFRAMGYAPATEFLQVDRLGFDSALWDLTVASKYCTQLDVEVAGLDFDASSDRFTRVRLSEARSWNRPICSTARTTGGFSGRPRAWRIPVERPAAGGIHPLSSAAGRAAMASRRGSSPPPSCASFPRQTESTPSPGASRSARTSRWG